MQSKLVLNRSQVFAREPAQNQYVAIFEDNAMTEMSEQNVTMLMAVYEIVRAHVFELVPDQCPERGGDRARGYEPVYGPMEQVSVRRS